MHGPSKLGRSSTLLPAGRTPCAVIPANDYLDFHGPIQFVFQVVSKHGNARRPMQIIVYALSLVCAEFFDTKDDLLNNAKRLVQATGVNAFLRTLT
jgi:hypothetical protein